MQLLLLRYCKDGIQCASTCRCRAILTTVLSFFFSVLVENATIPIRFEDYDKIYDLEWTELLQVDIEIPFAAYEELEKGMEVLAPWKDGRGSHIQYSNAFVVSEDDRIKEKKAGTFQSFICTCI